MPRFNGHTNTRHVTRIVGGDDLTKDQVAHIRSSDELSGVVPPMNHALGFVIWPALNVGIFSLAVDLIKQGYKVPLAAKMAIRVMAAHQASPDVDHWAIVVTENGNVSTLALNSVDLSAYYISGSQLAFALVVNLRLYSERVDKALAAANGGSERAVSHA